MKKKVCKKCEAEKTVDQYNKFSRSKDGLRYWCQECDREAHKEYKRRVRAKKKQTRAIKKGKKPKKIVKVRAYKKKEPKVVYDKMDPRSSFMKKRLERIKRSYEKILRRKRKQELAEERYLDGMLSFDIEADSELFDNSLEHIDLFSVSEY